MSSSGIDKFLFLFDKEAQRQKDFEARSPASFEGCDITAEEAAILFAHDLATLYEWGVHPLLIRNFGATVGAKYQDAYRDRGLTR